MKRGVVFTVRELLKVNGGKGFTTGRGISTEELNYLMLYWDKLVSPTNNFIHISLANEEELENCGVLYRPRFTQQGRMDGARMTEFHAFTHVEALNMMRKNEREVDWRMHFFNNEVSIHQEAAQQKEVVRFELAELLPVPPKDTPLQEILEFKERRSDELQALHGYLDELYFEVLNSGDFNLQRAKALSGLRASLDDLNKLNGQGWRSPIKFNLSTAFEFDLNQIVNGGLKALEALSSQKPLEIIGIESVVNLLGGFIKIRPQLQNVLKDGDPKLAYLTNATREGILEK
ncbi:DUF6236 family protein [Enterobacter hormaechei]|uniref:DUF6236 family protein n=1 Tax=Enterobacter hormaechei TaxID=158836 RepID=UPI0005CCB7A4|nr:DUF6236 family protein [Enterobacter hormaechei]KJC03445.1 hypothetical protein TN43_04540 [Enterobacter hormaechei]SAC98889.1 Uncharacterised protein [Enterobacter hormaechei]HCM9719609.1 hypothetical protein [Enterobacter hormaechei subsp. steigerwaltii]